VDWLKTKAAYPEWFLEVTHYGGYAMHEGTTASLAFPVPATGDVLTEVLREGAARMLAAAVEAEVAAYIARHAEVRDEQGRRRVVRNGYKEEREIQTGLGAIQLRQKPDSRRDRQVGF
jgi:hypothetical protein